MLDKVKGKLYTQHRVLEVKAMTQLYLLGLLHQKPMSGYDLQLALECVDIEVWGGILVGSIYYALNKLEKDGNIRLSAVEKTGKRQRSVYEITEKGKAAFLKLIYQSLATKPALYPTEVYAGLSFAHYGEQSLITAALQAQLTALQEERSRILQGQIEKTAQMDEELPAIVQLSFENMLAHVDVQLNYLHKLLTELSS